MTRAPKLKGPDRGAELTPGMPIRPMVQTPGPELETRKVDLLAVGDPTDAPDLVSAGVPDLHALIERTAKNGDFLPYPVSNEIGSALDGSGVRQFLEAAGFQVASNRDTGRNGEAITVCGIVLSTNGYACKIQDRRSESEPAPWAKEEGRTI